MFHSIFPSVYMIVVLDYSTYIHLIINIITIITKTCLLAYENH